MTVGVVVTTYRQVHYLAETLDSVCTAQTRSPDQVVVVEDGSSDGAANIASHYLNVRYHWQPNAGVGAARNAGLRLLSTDHVVFLDGDDRLLPNALEVGERALAPHSDAGWASARSRRIDGDGKPLARQPERRARVTTDHYRDLLRAPWICPPGTVMFVRSRLLAAGGWVEDRAITGAEDFELYLRMARLSTLVDTNAVTTDYRVHDANMSRNAAALLQAITQVLERERGHVRFPEDEAAREEGLAAFRRDLGLRASYQGLAGATGGRDRAQAAVGLFRHLTQHPNVFLRMAVAHVREPRPLAAMV